MAVRRALHDPRLEPTLGMLRVGRRLAIHGPARAVLLHLTETSAEPGATPHSPIIRLEGDGVEAIDQLHRTGATGPLRVDPGVVRALVDAWAADPAQRRVAVERDVQVARDLLADPLLAHLALGYFRCPPHPLGVTLTMAIPGLDPPPTLHYETSDLRTLLVYIPLMGPADGSGGHEVVLGTHGRKPLWQIARLHHDRDRALRDRKEGVAAFEPVPGTSWAEDPALLHRRIPASSPRLMATVGFAMRRTTPEGSCGHFRLDLPQGLSAAALLAEGERTMLSRR